MTELTSNVWCVCQHPSPCQTALTSPVLHWQLWTLPSPMLVCDCWSEDPVWAAEGEGHLALSYMHTHMYAHNGAHMHINRYIQICYNYVMGQPFPHCQHISIHSTALTSFDFSPSPRLVSQLMWLVPKKVPKVVHHYAILWSHWFVHLLKVYNSLTLILDMPFNFSSLKNQAHYAGSPIRHEHLGETVARLCEQDKICGYQPHNPLT